MYWRYGFMKDKLRPIWWLNYLVVKGVIPIMTLSNFEREKLISYLYNGINGRKIDLQNPKRFSEKIVWYMNYYDNDDFESMLCKVAFKDFVKNRIGDGHTAKLYGAWERVEDIDWDSLPDSFVLKSNCNSFGRCIKFIDNKDEIDFEELKKEIKTWLNYKNTGLHSYARGYYHVTPKIMAEEILGEARYQPTDYKIFCFNGVPTYAYSAFEHFSNGKAQSSKIAFYDMDWNALPVKYKKSEFATVEKPKHFDEMKKAAEILSQGLPFVRVDFYDTDEKYYVGELTFYSGSMSNSFTPDSFDFEMGEKFVLPEKQKAHRILRKDVLFRER